MSRLPLLELDEIPEEYHYLFTDDYLGDRHIFRAWAHNPEILEATLEYLNTLYEEIGQRRKELVILTVARARGARYEWHQHVDIARNKGVSIEEMRAIGTVTDPIHDALARHYSSAEIVAIGLLVDFYVGLCNYIASVDLPFEGDEFVGWHPDPDTVAELFDDA